MKNNVLRAEELPPSQYCDFNYDGIEFSIVMSEVERTMSEHLKAHRVWEPYQLNLYKDIMKEGDTFIDIGANVGINAIYAKKRIKNLSVIAIEPSPINYVLLMENIKNASVDIEVHRVAIANSNGSIGFAGSSGSNSKIVLSERNVELVPSKMLDTLMDELNLNSEENNVTAKIDVEGFTDLVLSEAYKTLSFLKQMIVEFSYQDVAHRLETQNEKEIYAHFIELYNKITHHLPHAYFISRENGLVATSSVGQVFQCMKYFFGIGDILFSRTAYPTISISFETFLSEKILELMHQNHLRILEYAKLKKLYENQST